MVRFGRLHEAIDMASVKGRGEAYRAPAPGPREARAMAPIIHAWWHPHRADFCGYINFGITQ